MHNPAGPESRKEVVTQYLIRYPLRYCTPVFIGVLTRDDQKVIANGTATLLRIGERAMIITDDHVVETYEKTLAEDSRVRFQIGAAPFDPLQHIIDRSKDKDLCTLDASAAQIDHQARDDDTNMPPLEFYQVETAAWPPPLVEVQQTVILGGFPGALRRQSGTDVTSESYSLAATPVTGVLPDYFTCNLDRSEWQTERGRDDPNIQLRDWGGLSGAPIMYDGHDTLRPRLVGFVMEYEPSYDQLKASHAALIRKDGTIETGTLF